MIRFITKSLISDDDDDAYVRDVGVDDLDDAEVHNNGEHIEEHNDCDDGDACDNDADPQQVLQYPDQG